MLTQRHGVIAKAQFFRFGTNYCQNGTPFNFFDKHKLYYMPKFVIPSHRCFLLAKRGFLFSNKIGSLLECPNQT